MTLLETADSLRYLAAAGGEWSALTYWPPLYPLALSVFGPFGVSVLGLASLVLIVRRHAGWLAVAIICAHYTVWAMYSHVLSETLFLPLVALSLWQADEGNEWRCSGAIALACLTRYVGVFLVPACAMVLPRRRWLVLALSLLPVFAWMAWNGDGPRRPGDVTTWQSFIGVCVWAFPVGGLRTRVFVTIACALGILARCRRSSSWWWLVVYTPAIVILATWTSMGHIEDGYGRLLTPLAPALAVVVAKHFR